MGGAQSSEQGQYGFHVLKVKANTKQVPIIIIKCLY
jgi:hypothetical protein